MLRILKTENNQMTELRSPVHGCWISVTEPSQQDIRFLTETAGIDPEFLRAALDEEETSRVDQSERETLVVVDLPIAEKLEPPAVGRRRRDRNRTDNPVAYTTSALAIIVTSDYVVTVSTKHNSIIPELENGLIRGMDTHFRTRFCLQLLLRIATRFQQFLRQIEQISDVMEKHLHRSTQNSELFQLLALEKSLVYFSASLKANNVTLGKISRGRVLPLYEDDNDLLEDVQIEVRQAIEMCDIYASVLSGTMSAFSSIISNNLNLVMKTLTCVTVLMAIPTMISGVYGMNVSGLPIPEFWFPIALSVALVALVGIWLKHRNLF